MKPPKTILDPDFQYTCSTSTNIRKTFARVRREMAAAKKQEEKPAAVVLPIVRKR